MAKKKRGATTAARGATTGVRKIDFDLARGYLVQTEFSASGGVTYDRRAIDEREVGRGLVAKFETVKKVDDVELRKDARSIVYRAYFVVDKHCARTPIGAFAEAGELPALERDFDEVRELAREFNRTARSLGSPQRVTAEIYALDVAPGNEGVARRLAGLVRERLEGLRQSLRAGDLKEFREARERARHLERLATGILRDSVRLALECADAGRKELGAAVRGKSEAEREKALRERAKLVDVEAIEAAIDLFTDPEGAAAEGRKLAEAEVDAEAA